MTFKQLLTAYAEVSHLPKQLLKLCSPFFTASKMPALTKQQELQQEFEMDKDVEDDDYVFNDGSEYSPIAFSASFYS
jgi:hypothetical protein